MTHPADLDYARERVSTPATALFAAGVVYILLDLSTLAYSVYGLLPSAGQVLTSPFADSPGGQALGGLIGGAIDLCGVAGALLGLFFAGVVLTGAQGMRELRGHSAAVAAAVAAAIHPLLTSVTGVMSCSCATPCWLGLSMVGIVTGLWCLTVLLDDGVRQVFAPADAPAPTP